MRKFASGSTSRNQKTTCANSASGIHCPRDEERLLLLVQLLVSTQNWARGEFVAKATKRKDSTHSQAEWVFCFTAQIFGNTQQNAKTRDRRDPGSIHDRLYAQILYPPERLAMIISMKMHATRQEIDEVRAQVAYFGYKVHSIEGEERVVIGVVGVGDVTACLESVESMPQVEKVVRISAPYKFVSKQFKPGRTRIRINGVEIGGDEFIVMAGPCSVESEKQIMED